MKAFGPLNGYTSKYASLSADEITKNSLNSGDTAFLFNKIKPDDPVIAQFWNSCYASIRDANRIIENIKISTALLEPTRTQLTADAKFTRALLYFYLVNLFGDVPLVLSTDYQRTAFQPRALQKDVYQQIVNDLTTAKADLPERYDGLPNSNIRPTSWAAAALLARVYLYQSDWTNAALLSSLVINNGTFHLASLNQVFMATSPETILQLVPAQADNGVATYNTGEAALFLPAPGSTKPPPCPLTDALINSFEPGDARKDNWVNSLPANGQSYSYPYKYKVYKSPAPFIEYNILLRLAEQYLIRAEAQARLGQWASAISDLNTLRDRAKLMPLSLPASQSQLLTAIIHERQVELFTEWGHRWFDVNRLAADTHQQDPLQMLLLNPFAAKKGASWQDYKKWWPIPARQLLLNPQLTQNIGY
jgi:hypothetical protein